MTRIARDAGLGRERSYEALSHDGNSELATVLKVLRALGLRLHVEAACDIGDGRHEARATSPPSSTTTRRESSTVKP